MSNRLPITVVEKDGELSLQASAGGLVSGLSAYLDSLKDSSFTQSEYLWVGWPGTEIDDARKEELRSKALAELHCYPVFLTEEVMEKFYQGFCNSTIWPLFHYFPSFVTYNQDHWLHYERTNQIFCDAVMDVVKPGDVVWVHDYHLMLLPKLLRERLPDIPIGFFLHIPFPSSEIFRLLPWKWRNEILEGLLGADLIGFHTYDYTQYFLRCVLRLLGYEHYMGQITTNERTVKAASFPMGIDVRRFAEAVNNPEVQEEKAKLREAFGDAKVVLSIDRLDYTKGIINRLQAYEVFLEDNPQWHGKVVLVVVVVPSRIDVERYEQMKKQIEEAVGRINGRFSGMAWTPILYQYRFLPFHPLVALYSMSDVALITPLRDGMNLIAKEFIATRTDQTGVLILSETAGAANELGEAIIINPNHREEIASALITALEMPEEEQKRRNQAMQTRLKSYDVVRWANHFVDELLATKDSQRKVQAKLLEPAMREQLYMDFGKAQRRLVLLDYDGTLVPFAEHYLMATPNEELLQIIEQLARRARTEVVLISGRTKDTLQSWFDTLHIGMVAEHGIWMKEKGDDWRLARAFASDWKLQLLPILESYTARVPGSLVEEKEFSLTWHYRRADPESGPLRAKELVDDLVHFTANIDIHVLQGNKVVEVRSTGVNKGTAGLHWLSKNEYDFVMAVGDDWTDEDLFKVLPETAYSIRVGMTSSHARFNLYSYVQVVQLLRQLAEIAT